MTDSAAWYEGAGEDGPSPVERIREGSAAGPDDWPARAVDSGFAEGEADYYDRLREATMEATRSAVRERERADDRQLIHTLRAMDDCERTANELAERVTEWAGSRFDDVEPGVEGARAVARREADGELDRRVIALAERVAALDEEAQQLRAEIERRAPSVAPNLAAMAGPVLAARLIALAGGLEDLAKQPAGTVQVLGAEEALFAHLRGNAPSPKHGVIFTHEFVRGTRSEDRGSAARALAGKLAIAARVDHYSGERKSELDEQLRERIEAIRARAEGESEGGDE